MSVSRQISEQKKKIALLPLPKMLIPKSMQKKINILIIKLKNPKTSTSVVPALIKVGPPAIPALGKLLKEKSPGLRAIVVEILGKIRDSRATPFLVRALKDNDGSVRSLCAISLGMIGDQRATPALIRALKDKDKDVRLDAASALGDLQDARALNNLISILGNVNEMPDLRKTAALSLGKIGDTRAITILENIRNLDPNIELQKVATAALNRIKLKSSYVRRRPYI